jgi:phycocyanobilin lyase beta subunit
MKTTQDLIAAVEEADSAPKLVRAVAELSAWGAAEAAPTLIRVLGFNNPGAAVAAVDGLVAMGKPAVVPLLEKLDGYNYGARAWAVRALSGIGDPRGLEVLLEAAARDFALSVRRAAARGLGAICWQDLPPEAIAEAKLKTLKTLLSVSEDPEWIVRYAAIVGLEGLATSEAEKLDGLPLVLERLQAMVDGDEVLAVSARARWARQKLMA